MFFKHNVRNDMHEYRYKLSEMAREITRLQKLENAVKNYSGGIYSLHERVNTLLLNGNLNNESTVSLLNDMAIYLRDLKIAGQLEKDSFPYPRHDH